MEQIMDMLLDFVSAGFIALGLTSKPKIAGGVIFLAGVVRLFLLT